MNAAVDEVLRSRVRNLKSMPAMPAILSRLQQCLELPPDQIEVEKVAELIATDESIAAQCMRIANSALFSRREPVETIRGAIIGLGASRLRDILWCSFLIRVSPNGKWPIDPIVFWEHSFGCALVSQLFAKKMGLPQLEKVYLCGLLHDIGELVNAALLPDDFRTAVDLAINRGVSIFEAEREVLGFTHCDTGKLLAEYWSLPRDVQEVIQFHHAPDSAPVPATLVAVVHLCDLLCSLRGMAYGSGDLREGDFHEDPAWAILEATVPRLDRLDVARFTLDLDAEAAEIHTLVRSAFQTG